MITAPNGSGTWVLDCVWIFEFTVRTNSRSLRQGNHFSFWDKFLEYMNHIFTYVTEPVYLVYPTQWCMWQWVASYSRWLLFATEFIWNTHLNTHTHSLVLYPTPFVLSFHSVIPSERVIPVIHKPSSEQTIIVTDHRNGSVSSKGKGW